MRRRRADKRKPEPDPVFGSPILGKFINVMMLNGKKSTISNVIYESLDIVKKQINEEPLKIFYQALENSRPRVVVKPRRVGGATYQVPMEVQKNKGYSIAMHWLRDFSRAKKGKPLSKKLAEEIVNAYKNEGAIIKKRSDTHRMAEANKAFAHFRF